MVLEYLLLAVGIPIALFIFGYPLFSVGCALIAFVRYHLFGMNSSYIDTLFYRGQPVPPPSRIKGAAVPILIGLAVWWWLQPV